MSSDKAVCATNKYKCSDAESDFTFPMVHEMVIKLVHKSCINLEISPPNHNLGLLPVYNLIGYFLQPI